MKLVLLPGLNGTDDFLADFSSELDGFELDIIVYPPELTDYDAIFSVVQKRLPKEDFVIVAESFSGPVAGRIADIHPTNLCGVIFVASFLTRPRRLPAFAASFLKVLPIRSGIGLWVADRFTMGRWSQSEFTSSFRSVLSHLPKSTIVKRLKAVQRLPRTSSAHSYPHLYLRPSKDRLIPLRQLENFTNVELIEGPHFLLQARPKQAALAVRTFVSALDT